MRDEDAMHSLSTAIAGLRELLDPVLDAVQGYKAECERRGLSPDAASLMAVDFHRLLVAVIERSARGGARKS